MSWSEFGNVELSYHYLINKLTIFGIPINENLKILDIGTNKGSLPYLIYTKNNVNMEGIDMEKDAIENGKREYPTIASNLFVVGESLVDIKSDYYDVVTMFDVIEHIPNISEYLNYEVLRILKPGGLFIFQTPNARINPIYETIQTKSFSRWKKWHCSLQTPKSLYKLLQNAGFKDITIEKYRIDSEYNKKKMKRYFGPMAKPIIHFFGKMPLGIYPNLWGVAKKY